MIITTTLSVEGRTVSEYLGIVSAAQVMVMPGGNKGVQRGWLVSMERRKSCCNKRHLLARMPLSG